MGATDPLYQALYRELREAILTGVLAPGARLQSSRSLAAARGIARNTVLTAYEQLQADGLIICRTGSGTYVSEDLAYQRVRNTPAAAAPRLSAAARRLPTDRPYRLGLDRRPEPGIVCDFSYGDPSRRLFPSRAWLNSLRAAIEDPRFFGYGSPAPEGFPPLRQAVAHYLNLSRRLLCTPEQVIIVSGSQQALFLVARLLVDPGDTIAVEECCFHGATLAFESVGAKFALLPIDADGLDPEALEWLPDGARLIYTTPANQFPTGARLSLERRLRLLDWANRHDAYVFEDDYDGEFRYRGRTLTPLQALDRNGRTIYCGTLSKILHGGIRLGYLVLPPALVPVFSRLKYLLDCHTDLLEQIALTHFIESGAFLRHLSRLRKVLAVRRQALLDGLTDHFGDRAIFRDNGAGQHVLVQFAGHDKARDDALIAAAAANGVRLYSAARYYLRAPSRSGLLFGYTHADVGEIERGLARLARCNWY
ncbi:MAG TPA: PLP-dependent aminotransferase family protein [Gammaproteobacteria bacterium]|nr:PLP-dependent aminotransferase family protein [Gammaproteobacteria bacterium]